MISARYNNDTFALSTINPRSIKYTIAVTRLTNVWRTKKEPVQCMNKLDENVLISMILVLSALILVSLSVVGLPGVINQEITVM